MDTKKRRITDEERDRASRQVVQSYIATTAVYDFNVYEKRVLYNLVKLAQSQIQGIRIRNNLCRIEHKYADFVSISLPISQFLVGEDDKNHSRVKAALKSLHQKTFTYMDDEVWECFSIIANPKIQLGKSEVSFMVDTRVWDVLLDFSKGFSRYDLDVAFSLDSSYSMRLYEMISSQKECITISIDCLRKIFRLEEKYRNTSDLISNVIERARQELDTKAPVSFTYRLVRTGNKITGISLTPKRMLPEPGPELLLRKSVRKYGTSGLISDLDRRYLHQIGFSDLGIENNIPLLYECRKLFQDFTYELSLIKGQCRDKDNPCGWCIETLKGKLRDIRKKL